MKLNSMQKKTFNTWNEHTRFSYNKAINLINQDFMNQKQEEDFNLEYFKSTYSTEKIEKRTRNTCYSKIDLRNLIIPVAVNSRTPWVLKTPYSIREGGVFEAYKNYDSAMTNYQNGNIGFFKLGFQSKRNKKWSINIRKENLKFIDSKTLGIYEERTTNFRIKTTEPIPVIENDCKIHYNGRDYYLLVPYTVEKKIGNKNKEWFCSLDPGIRKFQVLYNPEKDTYIKIADRASVRMLDLLKNLDFLLKNPKKNKEKITKLRIKIDNYQKELHSKVVKYLCENYNNILIPKLTKNNDIVKLKRNKKRRTLTKSNVRKMNVLGHCKFVERLKTKVLEYDDVNLRIIGEAYTSQTCISCEVLTKTSKEIFNCKNCNLEIDRDVLGSTNILLFNW